jgi:hypothetical protein
VTIGLVCEDVSASSGGTLPASGGGSLPIGDGFATLCDRFASPVGAEDLAFFAGCPVLPCKVRVPFGDGSARIDDAPSGIGGGPSWSDNGL